MKQKLTSRQTFILHRVSENKETSMLELVRRLGVSLRTIQRDVLALHGYLREFGVDLDTQSQFLKLVGRDEDVQVAVEHSGKLSNVPTLTSKNRSFYVALEMLLSQGPLKLNYLGKRLRVTGASVSHDLNHISDWLRSRGLKLIRQRGYGIEIIGDESARLEAIAELIHEQLSTHELMSILRSDSHDDHAHPLAKWLVDWFGAERLDEVRSVVSDEIARLNPPLDEAAFYGFMLHVLLACSRIETETELSDTGGPIQSKNDFELCTRILRRLVPNVQIVETEASYLSKHLRGAKLQMTEDSRILPLNITTMDLAFHLAERLNDMIHVQLTEDRELLLGLAQHLEPALYRMQTGLTIRNPLLEEVKSRYQSLFEAVRTASKEIIEPFGLSVPDAEIGYLTMHLGAALERWKSGNVWKVKIVCPNGISSAELLASRIRNEFPQVRVVSVDAVHTVDDSECDFIVSTVPMGSKIRPTITVSPFLKDEDILGIQRILQSLEQTYSPMKKRFAHLDTEDESCVKETAEDIAKRVEVWKLSSESVAQLIRQSAKRVVEAGDAEDVNRVVLAIEQRERLGSIVLPGKRFAVLHARSSALLHCHVAIYRLDAPIQMQSLGHASEWVDSVLVILARKEESPTVVRLLGRLSSALVMNDSILETLRKATNEDVRQRILETMNQVQE